MKKATQVGGEFLDLKELAKNGPVLAVFRIVEFQGEEAGDFGPIVPVIADVLICSGDQVGEVHLAEKFMGAATGTLRGVKNPKKGEHATPPVNAVGEEIACRIELVERKGSAGFVGLNVPSDVEYAEIERVHAGGAGWNVAPAGSVPAQANGQLVGAGAPTRPF